MQISRFQTSGSDPGGGLGMQNSFLRSKNANSFYQGRKNRKHYAHIEVLVIFLLVNFFSFLVIARNRSDVYGRNLVEIDPTSLPQLSIQLRDQKNIKKTEQTEIQNFGGKKTYKIKTRVFLESHYLAWNFLIWPFLGPFVNRWSPGPFWSHRSEPSVSNRKPEQTNKHSKTYQHVTKHIVGKHSKNYSN